MEEKKNIVLRVQNIKNDVKINNIVREIGEEKK